MMLQFFVSSVLCRVTANVNVGIFRVDYAPWWPAGNITVLIANFRLLILKLDLFELLPCYRAAVSISSLGEKCRGLGLNRQPSTPGAASHSTELKHGLSNYIR